MSLLRAEPMARLILPLGAAFAAWEARRAPVIVMLPDHLALYERAEFHTAALLETRVAVSLVDLQPERPPSLSEPARDGSTPSARGCGMVRSFLSKRHGPSPA